MVAHVISDKRLRRKRSVWSWLGRRFGALAVTLAALGFASWFAPALRHAVTVPARAPAALAPAVMFGVKRPEAVKLEAAAAPATLSAAHRRPRASIRLDARAEHIGDGYEVLNATELDAISQAH